MKDKDKRDVANENLESKKSGDEHYEFITETIKKRPVNKRKLVLKFFFTVFLAIVFGVVACATVIFVFPRLKAKYYPEQPDTKKVTIPVSEADNADEEPIEEFVPNNEDGDLIVKNEKEDDNDTTELELEPTGENEEDNPDTEEIESPDEEKGSKDIKEETETEAVEDTDSDKTEDAAKNSETTKVSETGAEGEAETVGETEESPEKGVVVNNVVERVIEELDVEDYRSLCRKISAVATTVQKSMVKVSGVASDTDWFNNTYNNNNSSAGLIIADNGKELLIVTASDILKNAYKTEVTFCDGKTYPCKVRLSDKDTNLTVLAVELADMEMTTINHIEMASFSTISSNSSGIPVIAVGAPYGVADSVALGQITSNTAVVDMHDSNAKIMTTDIYGSQNASGVIANLNGRIIGIICHEKVIEGLDNLLVAYSVMDLNSKIEKISNGQELAYMGIFGTDVTLEANQKFMVPMGAYVKKVEIDSPAMDAGIRSGDVIVKLGTTDISSFSEFKMALLKCQPMDKVVVTVERPGKDSYSEISYEVQLTRQ